MSIRVRACVCDYWVNVYFFYYCMTNTSTMPLGTSLVFVEWGNEWFCHFEKQCVLWEYNLHHVESLEKDFQIWIIL